MPSKLKANANTVKPLLPTEGLIQINCYHLAAQQVSGGVLIHTIIDPKKGTLAAIKAWEAEGSYRKIAVEDRTGTGTTELMLKVVRVRYYDYGSKGSCLILTTI